MGAVMTKLAKTRGGKYDGGGNETQRDDNDVHPSSSCYYRSVSSLADPPVPSLPGVAGVAAVAAATTTTRTTWRCCTGGSWKLTTLTPMAPMRWRGVVIDKLIPSLFGFDIIIT